MLLNNIDHYVNFILYKSYFFMHPQSNIDDINSTYIENKSSLHVTKIILIYYMFQLSSKLARSVEYLCLQEWDDTSNNV